MAAYYNEFEPYAAQWLRNLIAKGLIADGEVDGRSILDVRADDLEGFRQCHFFAGIGVWSHALRLAGWEDDREVWTGSCPCQPLSSAGKQLGHADERHVWPAFYGLVAERKPSVVFGEQVASKDGREWFAAVRADLEGLGYAIGGADLCGASVGAPHIRQRIFFVAEGLAYNPDGGRNSGAGLRDSGSSGQWRAISANSGGSDGLEHGEGNGRIEGRAEPDGRGAAGGRGASRLVDGLGSGLEGRGERSAGSGGYGRSADGSASAAGDLGGVAHKLGDGWRAGGIWNNGRDERAKPDANGADGRLADAESSLGANGLEVDGSAGQHVGARSRSSGGIGGGPYPARNGKLPAGNSGSAGPEFGLERAGANDEFWRAADWLFCRDGKWRPVEPGTFPLAHGASSRVGRLRAYGNAIIPQVAAEMISAFMECRP